VIEAVVIEGVVIEGVVIEGVVIEAVIIEAVVIEGVVTEGVAIEGMEENLLTNMLLWSPHVRRERSSRITYRWKERYLCCARRKFGSCRRGEEITVESAAAKTPEGIIPVMLEGVPRDFEYNNYKEK
jgi:hypothetical protein